MTTAAHPTESPPPRSRWKRWLIDPLKNQLTRGIAPDRLGWTIAAAVTLGIFPIMGTTSLVCFLFGAAFKLNQPVLHAFKTLVYPLHLALILVFIRAGQWLHGDPLLALSIPQMLVRFQADPMQFARDFGLAAWRGVTAWFIIAPFLAVAVKFSVTPLLRRMAARLRPNTVAARL
jgi:hypothetical protein